MFPALPNAGTPGILDFHYKSRFPDFPGNPDFRISHKSGKSGFPDFPENPENPDCRMSQKSGETGFPKSPESLKLIIFTINAVTVTVMFDPN